MAVAVVVPGGRKSEEKFCRPISRCMYGCGETLELARFDPHHLWECARRPFQTAHMGLDCECKFAGTADEILAHFQGPPHGWSRVTADACGVTTEDPDAPTDAAVWWLLIVCHGVTFVLTVEVDPTPGAKRVLAYVRALAHDVRASRFAYTITTRNADATTTQWEGPVSSIHTTRETLRRASAGLAIGLPLVSSSHRSIAPGATRAPVRVELDVTIHQTDHRRRVI
jgi:Seven in absentia protein family